MTPSQKALNDWTWKHAEIVHDKEPSGIGRIMLFVVSVCAVHAIVWWV